MRQILMLREIASDDGLDGQHVEILRRDPSCMEILCMRAGSKIYSRGPHSGNSGDQRGDVVAQQFPLLTVYSSSLIRGIDRPHALRMSVWEFFQQERVHNRKDRRVCPDRKRQGK